MTTQREIAERLGLPVHPPKVEIFDLDAGTNTDPKGYVRSVDEYRQEPFGLFLARPIPQHHRLTYVQSWLLPTLGLRVTRWEYVPGREIDQDFYLDVVDVSMGNGQWRSVDYYLDISVATGRHAELLDVDEFMLALQANLLDAEIGQRAMETTFQTVDGLARHGYDLPKWLRSEGIELSWRDRTV